MAFTLATFLFAATFRRFTGRTTTVSDATATSGDGTKSESDPAQIFPDAEEDVAAGTVEEVVTAGVESLAVG